MPIVPIINYPYQNAEELGATSTGTELIDGYIDEFKTLTTRGGLIKWVNFPDTPSGGGYWWRERKIFVAVFEDHLYRVNSDLTVSRVTTPAAFLEAKGRASFASNEYWLYVANGKNVIAWDGTNAPTQMAFPNSYPVSTLAYIDGYILGNGGGTRSWYYADPDPSDASKIHVWAATGLSKDGGPDLLQGVFAKWREVMVMGDRTCEIWYDSGSTTSPFERIEGAFIEMGTPSAATVVNADNTWIWLNQFREIIRLEGRTPKIISGPIKSRLKNLSKVDDAVATFMDGKYIISFPTDNVTWVYDFALQYWCRWGKWEEAKAGWDRWLGESAVEADSYGVNIVTGRNGHLYIYHPLITLDNQEAIRCLYRGPHVTHGTYKRKVSHLIVNVKQGMNREVEPGLNGFSDLLRLGVVILPSGTRCSAFSYTVPAVEGYTAVSISGFPSGLTFDQTEQLVSGIPLDSGDFNVTINYQTPSGLVVPMPGTLHLEDASPVIKLPGE